MNRRTLLAGLLISAAIVAAAAWAGFEARKRMATDAEVAAAGTADEVQQIRDDLERTENILSLSFGIAALVALSALAAVIVAASGVPSVARWRGRVFQRAKSDARDRVFLAFALGVAFVLAGIALAKGNGRNAAPEGDEISYLEAAFAAKERYGVAGFPLALYAGKWSEANRHPLYIWAIMPFAPKSVQFFAYARLLSTLFAAAAAVVAFLVFRSLFGAAASILMLFLYALNPNFVEVASQVACEGLLAALVTASFYFTVRGFENGKLLAAGGAFAGLAYLAKLNGLFLPAAFFIAAIAVWRLGAFRKKEFYLYFAAFVVAASPLLVRNAVRFHNPLSDSKAGLLWVDSREQTQSMRYIEGKTGLRSFLSEKKPLEMGLDILEGGEQAIETAGLTVSPLKNAQYVASAGSAPFRAGMYLGFAMLLLAGAAVLFDANPARRAFVVSLAAVAGCSMVWFAKISVAPRFVLPFAPIILGYLSAIIVSAWAARPYQVVILASATALGFWGVAHGAGVLSPFAMKGPTEDTKSLAAWLDGKLEPSDVYLVGPDDSLRFGWWRTVKGRPQSVPATKDIQSLVAASRKLGARYVVISRTLYENRFLQMSGTFVVEDEGLKPVRRIKGWKPVYRDPFEPVRYIVFEVEKEGEAAVKGDVTDGK